ncbi:hypothetical protein JZ751_023743 [Albula glossodonta]|uniref:WH2 domain-containing protein n=1 Tax=Albula glossodonta TaxID=121402 RepID=A0A8T2NK30_9TELE|nr:hypothetical protein JZ751_023743 [Albula glossodonta]
MEAPPNRGNAHSTPPSPSAHLPKCTSGTSYGMSSLQSVQIRTFSNGYDAYGLAEPAYLAGAGPGGPYPFLPPPPSSSSSSSSSSSRAWSRPASALLPDFPHYCTLGPGMFPSSRVPSWKDWAKPGPYDQPMVNTLRRSKEKREVVDADASATATATNSLQCSSGYSTQTTTPCCSEDTIPSQVSDYDYFSVSGDQEVDQQDFDKSSTIPRNSDISQSYRKMFQAKRPASTAGLPSNAGPIIVTPGVATIRRTPSTKPSVRRATMGGAPIPIRTPVIPVKTPTVPGCVAFSAGSRADESEDPMSPDSPTAGEDGDPTGVLPVASWSGQASTNPPTLPPHLLGATDYNTGALEDPGAPFDTHDSQGDNMLLAIRRGVRLKRTMTNDRSAPRIA